MAEFKLGRIRFVWKDDWTAGTVYVKDDIVRYGGKTYLCQLGHTSNSNFNTDLDVVPTKWNLFSDGQRWRDAWTIGTSYEEGDLVSYGGNIYVCIDGHTSAATTALGLEQNSADWNTFVEGFDWKGDWTVSTRYKLNDIVRYGGINYICTIHHTSAATAALGLEVNSGNWQIFTQGVEYKGGWVTATRYKVNDVVKWGAGSWICITQHTAGVTFPGDSAYWSQFVEGFEFESTWNSSTAYQPGDVVRYGGNQYVAKTLHTNSNPLTGTSDWDLFAENLRYRSDWVNTTSYRIGEVVKYNGYSYLAITDSPATQYTVTSVVGATDYWNTSDTAGMVEGMSVRFTGTTFGNVFTGARYYIRQVISSTAFTISTTPGGTIFNTGSATGSMTATVSAEPPNSSYWSVLAYGLNWRGEWTDDVEYNAGDTVRYGSNVYTCILGHRSEGDDGSTVGAQGGGQANSRPDQDTTGVYWQVFNIGDELSVLSEIGDLVYYGGAGPARLPIGTEGQILRVSSAGIPEWVTWGYVDQVYYVSPEGTDLPAPAWGRTIDKPWKTIRYACEQVEKGPRYPNSQKLLELNRAFLQKEITEWIQYQVTNNISPFTSSFDYDEFKCERDVGFIIDRVIWDIGHGGNLKVRSAAFSFLGAFGEGEELSAPEENQPYLTLAAEAAEGVAAYNYLQTIMEDVVQNQAPAINYQILNADNSTAVIDQYIDTDLRFEEGVIEEITDLIDIVTTALTDQVTTNLPERRVPNSTINLKTGQYRETLPIIVPAETALVGDEKRSVNAGPAGSLISRDDVKYSIGALSRLESILGDIVVGNNITESAGNNLIQSADVPLATNSESEDIKQLIRVMQHNIDFRVGTTHMASLATPVGYNTSFLTGFGDARKLIIENKEFIKDEITAFITVNYSFVKYSKTKCRRDVGFIVDALAYDLLYGGAHQTLIAGLAYFDGNNSTTLMIDSSEVAATAASYSRLKTICQQIAANTVVSKSIGNNATQWRDTANLTGGSAASTRIGTLVDIIINIIQGDSTTSLTPQINITTIATTDTFTSSNHGMTVGDAVIPRTTGNGLVKGRKYWVSGTVATNTFQLSETYGGTALTTFVNGTGLDLDFEVIDYPTATNGVTSTTALITAAQTLDAAQETIVQNVIDDLNVVAWHTDFVVDDVSLTTTQFRIYVGKNIYVHTYVSGGTVTKASGATVAITNFVYNESTGYAIVTTGTHGLEAGDIVDITDVTLSCTSSGTTSTFVFPNESSTQGGVTKIRYKQNKCIRDVRLILESVMYDFMFDTNYQTRTAAYSYLRASARDVYDLGQKQITRDALTNAKTEALANVGGNATAQARITSLMTLLDDIIYGSTNEGSICQSEIRTADWARLQLERNRDYIVAEIDAYIDTTYKSTISATDGTTDVITCDSTAWMHRNAAVRFTGNSVGGIVVNTTYYIQNVISATTFTIATSRNATTPVDLSTASGSMTVSLFYNSDSCLRDVHTYIDAIKFDVQYPGNYKSRMAARYYANAVTGSYEEDMYYLRNGTGIRNQTLDGLNGDLLAPNQYGTSRVSAGAYCSLDPGWGPDDFRTWIIKRSPYVQNVATFGYAAVGQKIDGALHNGGNDSIVSNDFTQIISDGIGAWVTNNGRAELVSVFTYYAHIGYLSENGGRIRGTNGNNSYGDFGSVAEGFDANETPITCTVDNKAFVASVGSTLTNGVDFLWQFEYDNAGQDYTTAEWVVSGGGTGAEVEQVEFRDGAVFQVRLLDNVDDSAAAPETAGNYGGFGYISNANTAQGGTLTQITIAATDDEISSAYVGMKIILTAGAGAGQVGIISTYTSGTKVATITKESDGSAGWDHIVPGTTLSSPDASTTYVIEPRISFTSPVYSSASRTLATAQTYSDAIYAPTVAIYSPISGTSSGDGTGATFTIARRGTKYFSVKKINSGTGYVRLDTITIAGTSLGGASTANDLTITILAVNSTTGAILDFEYEGLGSGGRYVAVSSGSRNVNYSTDGSTWTAGTTALPSTSNWSALAVGDLKTVETAGLFVVGRGYVITSLGITDFTAIGAAANIVGTYFVATGVGTGTGTATPVARHLVAVSTSTTVNAFSVDGGVTWTSGGALPSSGSWTSVAYGDGVWLAIRSGSTDVAKSINGGVTWQLAGALPASTTWTSIAYGKGVWVAIASGGQQAASSIDAGANWLSRTLPSSSNWNSVAYGRNRFVAVSNTSGTVAAYSSNGTTWTAATLPSTGAWTSIRYGQGVFFAVNSSSNNGATTEDGINWTTRALTRGSGTGFLAAVHGNSNQNPLWIAIPSASTTAASSAVAGATTQARAYVADNKIFAIRITEPGSSYSSAPTITITDPNDLFEAPTSVRIGNGVLANPSFVNRGTGYDSALAELDTGDGYADNFQSGKFLAVKRLTNTPSAGANVVLDTQPDFVYKLVNVLSISGEFIGGQRAFFQVSPNISLFDSPPDETDVTTRIRYSQVRLTGHDFLDIGTGNFEETNYPNAPSQAPNQNNETADLNGGRVFYTSTDQDGNFRVGELFTIEQSTGIATLNADAFNIAGLAELSLGNITLGGNSATITEFSTDPFFTANSDSVVPTQKAIKSYISAQIGGGGAALNVNSLVAGFIFVAGTQISTTTGATINMNASFNFTAGVRGYPVAWNYFLN